MVLPTEVVGSETAVAGVAPGAGVAEAVAAAFSACSRRPSVHTT